MGLNVGKHWKLDSFIQNNTSDLFKSCIPEVNSFLYLISSPLYGSTSLCINSPTETHPICFHLDNYKPSSIKIHIGETISLYFSGANIYR